MDCLEASQGGTGNLVAFYDFESGVNDCIYNRLYTSGEQLVGSIVHTDMLPGLSVGKTDWPVSGSGYFAGEDKVRVGLRFPPETWSIIMDINPNLCSYRDQRNVSKILISTMDSPTSVSGFHVGINQSNRLYIQYNNDQQIHTETLPQEINTHAVIGIAQGNTSASVYCYDLNTESTHSISTANNEVSGSNYLYFGDFASNSDPLYSGYEGYIKHISLFSGNFGRSDIDKYCSCMFSEGITVSTSTRTDTIVGITGSTEVPIYETGITGFVNVSAQMPQENGSSISIFYKSGVTGLIEVGKETVLLSGVTSSYDYDVSTTGIDYDETKQKLYNRYYLNFREDLTSGEKIEIHNFESPRHDTSLVPGQGSILSGDKIKLYYRGAFQQASGDKTFLSDHDFDYHIEPSDGEFYLQGYTDEDPYITYDLVDTGSICIDYSGHWGNICAATPHPDYPELITQTGCEANNAVWLTGVYVYTDADPSVHSRVDIYPGGFGTPTQWHPERAQFIETGNNTVTITGVSGENGFVKVHEKDIYLNGQRLVYGEGYRTGIHTEYGCDDVQWSTKKDCEDGGDTWAIESTGGSVVLMDLPGWAYDHATSEVYEGKTIYTPQDIVTPELCFSPKTMGDSPNILFYDVQIDPSTTIAGIPDPLLGFSEIIWVNGLRQQEELDYRLGWECSLTKSFTNFEENPFNFYNNSVDLLNIG